MRWIPRPGTPATPATSGPPPSPGRAPLLGWRTWLAGVVVTVATAAAVGVFGLGQLHQAIRYLDANRSVKVRSGVLAADSGLGGPETILLVGDDTRSGQSDYRYYQNVVPNLANETLLVRLDPAAHQISLLSIPRELLTTIRCPTGIVQNRFNYSLACGGFTTLLATVKQVTGLSVNHVMELDFENFEKAIDELGCVYYQVDERYYHVNVPGGPQYQQINLQPGYQKLCGTQAEQFVSYRHSDTSLVRDARDQTFLLAARQQYEGQLLSDPSKFERVFGQLVSADAQLKTTTGLEDLLAAVIGTAGYPVRQVQVGHIDYDPTNPAAVACACITAPHSALVAAAHSFLDGAFEAPSRHRLSRLARAAHRHRADLALTPVNPAEHALAAGLQTHLPFRVVAPTVQVAAGGGLGIDTRAYELHAPDGRPYPAFVEVFSNGLLGQYYDIEGTTWTDPPALDDPTATLDYGHTVYDLTYTGPHITQIAWSQDGAVYWVHNSLTDGVTNGQMLAIAEQTVPVSGAPASHPVKVRLKPAKVPKVKLIAVAGGGRSVLTKVLGALGVLAFLALAAAVLRWRRRLSRLRRDRAELAERIARLEAHFLRSGPSRSTSPATGRGRRTRGA